MSCGHEWTARTENHRFARGRADIQYVCKIQYGARTMQGLFFCCGHRGKVHYARTFPRMQGVPLFRVRAYTCTCISWSPLATHSHVTMSDISIGDFDELCVRMYVHII